MIQFYRPYKNIQGYNDVLSTDILVSGNASKEIARLYKNACYDCHSNYTDYKWFDNIAPISWFVDNNIKRGILSLDFSNWKNLSTIQKEIMFSAIPYNLNTNRMPPSKYRLLHSKAELSKEDKTKMIKWITEVKTKFLKEENLLMD